tara:strand:- start:25488 stop:26156 length:669 start_codon:yes stop_codon:yes gene_type:complete
MTDTVDTLKQRIVGAFVIISLAVIFLPMIFDEPHEAASNVIAPVPSRPAFKVIEIDKPIRPVFNKVEFDPKSQKIVEKEPQLTSQNSGKESSDDKGAEAENKTVSASAGTAVIKTSIKSESAEKLKIQEKSDSTPSVNHLPLFKNVWMVQLGTFSQTDNAYQLRDKLRKDGFDGHTKKVELNGKDAIRVFTGPFVDKAEAEKIKIKLDKKYKVVSRVLFFDA